MLFKWYWTVKLEPLNLAKCLLELPQGDLLYIIYDLDLEINSLTVDINLGVNPWVGIRHSFYWNSGLQL